MWFIVILFVATAIGGEVDVCTLPPSNLCGQSYIHVTNVPGDTEELHQLCLSLSDQLECLHKYDSACERFNMYKGLKHPVEYNGMRSLLDDACDRTGSLHNVLALNIDCIKRRVSYREAICSRSREKALRVYARYVNTHEKTQILRGQGYWKDCLRTIYTAGCVLDDIEKECGYRTFMAVVNVVSESKIFADSCDFSIFPELHRLTDVLRLDEDAKAILKKYLSLGN